MNTVQPIRDPEIVADIKVYLKEANPRDFIMFLLGVDTGLRISDVLKLRVRDVIGSHIILREKKTSKEKRILITPELKRELKPYIEGMEKHTFLIQSRQGKNRPIGRSMAYKILRQVAEEFQLSEIGCHTLRKTFGYIMYHHTQKDIGALMEFFGHSSQRMTLRYIGLEQDTLDGYLKGYKSS